MVTRYCVEGRLNPVGTGNSSIGFPVASIDRANWFKHYNMRFYRRRGFVLHASRHDKNLAGR